MNPQKKKSAFSAGLGYTFGNILIKGINILTLPLFSRLMTTEEFGVFNVFMAFDAILFVIVGLALHSSIRSANLEFRGEIDHFTSSITLIYLAMTSLFVVAVLLFGQTIGAILGFEQHLLYLLIFCSASSALLTLYNTRISLDYSYKKYLAVAFINSIGNVVISLILVLTVFRSQRDLGRILGATSISAIIAVWIIVSMYRKAKPRFNWRYWRFALKYSLPVVPHGVSQVLLAQFDRIMIRNMISDAAAGIYSLAGNLKLILTVITTSISSAWSTWFFEEMAKKNLRAIQQRGVQLSGLFTILAIGLMALSPELILILGGREYDMAKYVAIPIILDGFVMFLYDLIVTGEYYAKKTVYIMLGTMAAAVLNVVLNYIFILKYGFIAAAYTTLVSYICYLVLHLLISRRVVGFFIVPVKWLMAFFTIASVMTAVNLLLLDNLLVRWTLCAVVVIPMALVLLKSVGGAKKLLNRNTTKENY